MEIEGKTVLLTGATGGLGRAMAHRLAGAGATLIASGRKEDALTALVDELPGSGHSTAVCDLGQPDAATRLAATLGPVDCLVANAALPATGRLTESERRAGRPNAAGEPGVTDSADPGAAAGHARPGSRQGGDDRLSGRQSRQPKVFGLQRDKIRTAWIRFRPRRRSGRNRCQCQRRRAGLRQRGRHVRRLRGKGPWRRSAPPRLRRSPTR